MKLEGANRRVHIEGADRLAGRTNYFIGGDPKRWQTAVPNFAKVKYASVYRGIDLIFYGNPTQLEYDFVIAPTASPKQIRLAFAGAQKLEVDAHGDLIISVGGERIELRKPVVYQDGKGGRHDIAGEFAMLDKSTVGFKVGDYDHTRPLVIDPTLVWAKIIPGNFLDIPNKVAVDSNNNPYIAGFTCSGDYPVTKVANPNPRAGCDAFVTKLDGQHDTAAVIYSTIIGGSNFDNAMSITVDGSYAAYVSGQTYSSDFPAPNQFVGNSDAFVAKLNSDGTLAWSRLFGGSNSDIGGGGWTNARGVAIPQGCASNCNAYITGQTTMSDYPTTANAYQGTHPNFFNMFLTAVSSDGSGAFYSTFFGGGFDPLACCSTVGNGIAVDGSGAVYVAGLVDESAMPTTTGSAFGGTADGFAAKFDPSQSGAASLLWARYLGGSGWDSANQIVLDPGCASNCPSYVAGQTYSHDFLGMSGFGGNADAFVVKLDASGGILSKRYVGDVGNDSANDISIDPTSGTIYVIGTSEEFYPSVSQIEGAQPPNGILLKSTDGGVDWIRAG